MLTDFDTRKAVDCALGRIFSMMYRPERNGDIQEYYRCRDLVISLLDVDTSTVHGMNMPMPGWSFGRGTTGVIE